MDVKYLNKFILINSVNVTLSIMALWSPSYFFYSIILLYQKKKEKTQKKYYHLEVTTSVLTLKYPGENPGRLTGLDRPDAAIMTLVCSYLRGWLSWLHIWNETDWEAVHMQAAGRLHSCKHNETELHHQRTPGMFGKFCGLITVDFEALLLECHTWRNQTFITCEPPHYCSTSVTHVQNYCTDSRRGNLFNKSWKMTPWCNAAQMWGCGTSLFYKLLDSSEMAFVTQEENWLHFQNKGTVGSDTVYRG